MRRTLRRDRGWVPILANNVWWESGSACRFFGSRTTGFAVGVNWAGGVDQGQALLFRDDRTRRFTGAAPGENCVKSLQREYARPSCSPTTST